MTEQPKAPDLAAEGDEDPRKQLWIRAGVAGGLIAVLLGGLAIFDHLSKPPPPPEEVVAPTKPIAPAQVTPAGRDAPPEVLRAGSTAASEVPPLPASDATEPPALPADAKADKAERLAPARKIAEGTRPLVPPAASPAQTGTQKPAVGATDAVPAARPAPVRTEAAAGAPAPTAVTPLPARPTLPQTAASPAQPSSPATPAAPTRPSPAASEPSTAYLLQVGVFSTPAQADALRARLMADGIPAQLETRVVVGPFNDRRDALAAQARLREKGFSAAEMIPFRR